MANTPPNAENADGNSTAKAGLLQSLEHKYKAVNKEKLEREQRRQRVLQLGRSRGLDASSISRAHAAAESAHLRKKRGAISAGDFEQLTLIGRGAFGEVWTCREHASGAVYAMKKLDKEAMVERGHVQHVRAEVDVMSEAVTSEWVVQLHCSFSDARHLYLVMEYVPGGDLMALLMKKDILSEDDTRFYMAETALALSDLHRLGFMHRDVKPDNLLLDADGHIKLTDFGLAKDCRLNTLKISTSATVGSGGGGGGGGARQQAARIEAWQRTRSRAHSTVGTHDYMSPEVLMGANYDYSCDWWAVGVITFECLVGYPPFTDVHGDPRATCANIVNCRDALAFPPESSLSPAAVSFVRALLCGRHTRLGRNGADEVKSHRYFGGVVWGGLRAVGAAPFKPTIASATDTSHFDTDNLLPEETPPPARPRAPSKHAELAFAGYRYVRPSTTAEDILLSARTPPAHPLAAVTSPARRTSFGCLTNCLAGWLGNSGDAYARHRAE